MGVVVDAWELGRDAKSVELLSLLASIKCCCCRWIFVACTLFGVAIAAVVVDIFVVEVGVIVPVLVLLLFSNNSLRPRACNILR